MMNSSAVCFIITIEQNKKISSFAGTITCNVRIQGIANARIVRALPLDGNTFQFFPLQFARSIKSYGCKDT